MRKTPLEKYANRIVRYERLKMLMAPPVILNGAEDLIKESASEVGHVSAKELAKAIEDEIIREIKFNFEHASCFNCVNFNPEICHSSTGICFECPGSNTKDEMQSCFARTKGKGLCEKSVTVCDKYMLDVDSVFSSVDIFLLERLAQKYRINIERVSSVSDSICSKILSIMAERERSKN